MQKIQELIAEVLIPEIAAQKSRLFLWMPFFFAVGIAIYFGLKLEPSFGFSIFVLIALTCITIGFWKYQECMKGANILFIAFVALSLMMAGFAVAKVRSHLAYTPMLLKKMSPVEVIGVIDMIEPLGGSDGSRIILRGLEIERLSPNETPRKIRLSVRKDEGLKAGQRVKILGGLNPASGPVAPRAFDFQRMAYFKNIGAVGFAFTAPEILEDAPNRLLSLKKIRQVLSDKITAQTSEPQQSIVMALMTGQRGAISDENWQALRDSGLAHLLAISGLHVGMVAGVVFFFSRLLMACWMRLALHYPIKKYAAFIALVAAFFYTIMVGATIPTQRALLMTGFVMVAIMMDRSPFSLRLVALAALVVLFFSPESLTSVSFQMSFTAVAALICFYEWARPVWMGMHRQAGMIRRFVLYFAGVSLTTLVAGLATGLFALFHFQNYAVYGLLANMIAVPLMAFIVMPLIVLSYVLMPLGLEGVIMPFIEWAVGWILATAHYVAGLDGAVWNVAAWPHWIFIAMVVILWTSMIWQGRLKVILLPVFIMLIGLIFVYKQPDILISSRGELVALQVHNQDQGESLWLSTGRTERYTAANWMRSYGLAGQRKLTWPKEGSVEGFPLSCDSYGCRGEVNGQRVAVTKATKAWREDCAWADIVIAHRPVTDWECDAPYIIDYFDVWRNGAYAIWVRPDEVRIETVEGERGKRLWTQTSANNKDKKD